MGDANTYFVRCALFLFNAAADKETFSKARRVDMVLLAPQS
jgi:hypothetical protein